MPALSFLIIDDNELQRRVVESCLEHAGHRVMFTATADDVGALVRDCHAGVVLLSAALPKDEARRALSASLRPRCDAATGTPLPPPVVVVGAGANEASFANQLVARGAAGTVARPYERSRLLPQLELYSVGAAPAHVLVIDDSDAARRTSASILRRAGHTPIEACSGEEGVALLDQHPEIDLVLTDIVMPKLDGYQVCQAVRARPGGHRLPVLLLTALDDIASQSRAIEVGADDVLTKPITATELQLRVRSMLRLKSLQRRLALRNEELEHALQVGQHLTHMLVHDFRNPLTRVLVSAEMIVDACASAGLEDAAELGHDVLGGALRLRGLSDDLLFVAHAQVGGMDPEPSVVALSELTDAAVADLRRAADASDVRLRCQVPADLCIEADRDLILRVVQNLLDNALKHSPRSGRVALRAARHGDEVRVEVTDDRPEAVDGSHERVLAAFGAGAAPSRTSGGLDLAFCRLAVEAHGGQIGVTPRADGREGSTFWFTLPAAPAAGDA